MKPQTFTLPKKLSSWVDVEEACSKSYNQAWKRYEAALGKEFHVPKKWHELTEEEKAISGFLNSFASNRTIVHVAHGDNPLDHEYMYHCFDPQTGKETRIPVGLDASDSAWDILDDQGQPTGRKWEHVPNAQYSTQPVSKMYLQLRLTFSRRCMEHFDFPRLIDVEKVLFYISGLINPLILFKEHFVAQKTGQPLPVDKLIAEARQEDPECFTAAWHKLKAPSAKQALRRQINLSVAIGVLKGLGLEEAAQEVKRLRALRDGNSSPKPAVAKGPVVESLDNGEETAEHLMNYVI